ARTDPDRRGADVPPATRDPCGLRAGAASDRRALPPRALREPPCRDGAGPGRSGLALPSAALDARSHGRRPLRAPGDARRLLRRLGTGALARSRARLPRRRARLPERVEAAR